MSLDTSTLTDAAHALADRLVEHRRTLHRHPELAWEEHRTAAYVESVLDGLGVEHRRVVGTGVVAVLRGRGPGCVGVRADLDALPVEEVPGREGYRSQVPGLSHACGHDAHTAIVLGLAELLAGVELPGTVVLYFQPAEEGTGGAAPMVAAGVLDDPEPDAILSVHVSSRHASGVVGLRAGPVTASADLLWLTVRGIGGHAAHPHHAIDPVPVAAEIILAVQQVLTREVDPVLPAVITFGTIQGGTRPNVIAPSVTLGATLRAVDPDVRELLVTRVGEVAQNVATAHRASVTVEVERGVPVGVNDAALTTIVADAVRAVLGEHRLVMDPHPSLGAEDFFAFGATGIPVTMFRLGVADRARGITAAHHSPDFDIDEAALPHGLAVFAETIRRLLTPATS